MTTNRANLFATAHPCDDEFKKNIDVLGWSPELTPEFTQPFFVSINSHASFATLLVQIIARFRIEVATHLHDEYKHLIAICKPSVRSVDNGTIMLLPTSQTSWKHAYWLSRDNMVRVLVTALVSAAESTSIPWSGVPECARRLFSVVNRNLATERWQEARAFDGIDGLGGADIYFEELFVARNALQSTVPYQNPLAPDAPPEHASTLLILLAKMYFNHIRTMYAKVKQRPVHMAEKPEHAHGLWEQFFYQLLQEPHGTPLAVSSADKHVAKELGDAYRELTDQFPFHASVFRIYVQSWILGMDIEELVRSDAPETTGFIERCISDLRMLDAANARLHNVVGVLEQVKLAEQSAADSDVFLSHYWQFRKGGEELEPTRAMSMILGKRLWRSYEGMSQFHHQHRNGSWRLFTDTNARNYYRTMRSLWPADTGHMHIATSFIDPRLRHENLVALNTESLDWQLTSLLGFLRAARDTSMHKETIAANQSYARAPEFAWFAPHVLYGVHHAQYGWHIFRCFVETLCNITLHKEQTINVIHQMCSLLARCQDREEVMATAVFYHSNLVRERYEIRMTTGGWQSLCAIVHRKRATFEHHFPQLCQDVDQPIDETQELVLLSYPTRHDIYRFCVHPSNLRNIVLGIIRNMTYTYLDTDTPYVVSLSERVGNADLRLCASARGNEYLPPHFKSATEDIPLQWPVELSATIPNPDVLYLFLVAWETEARQTQCNAPSYEDITRQYHLPPLAFVDQQWCYLSQCMPMKISTQGSIIFSDRLRHLVESFVMQPDDVVRGARPLRTEKPQVEQDTHLTDASPLPELNEAQSAHQWTDIFSKLKSGKYTGRSIGTLYCPTGLS